MNGNEAKSESAESEPENSTKTTDSEAKYTA